MPNLSELARWYARHCDGTWEHQRGISIQSTDNPGWWVKIDLNGTALVRKTFVPVAVGIDAQGHPAAKRWLHCAVRNEVWEGAGDETRLEDIIDRFLAWATN